MMSKKWLLRRQTLKIVLYLLLAYVFVFIYEHCTLLSHKRGKQTRFEASEEVQEDAEGNSLAEYLAENKDVRKHRMGSKKKTILDFGSKNKRSDDKTQYLNMTNDVKENGNIRENESSPSSKRLGRKRQVGGCDEKGVLHRDSELKIETDNVTCKPHRTPDEACKFTEEVYRIDSKLQKCADNTAEIYCRLIQDKGVHFACQNLHRYTSCEISRLNKVNGMIEVQRRVAVLSDLQMHLRFFAKVAMDERSHFLFLKCFHKHGKKSTKTQFILLPFEQVERIIPGRSSKLNINIVLLDSISRAHFYRSLPKVVKAFNSINKDKDSAAEILDFELFQSVHGHSAENFHSFFTGKLLPSNLTATEKEQSRVGVDHLYGIMKAAGYESMYQDDLCWRYWWGIRMELGMAADWKSLQQAIKTSSIDYTGLTFASCKILGDNDLKTPFNGPESSQICFNGQFQHSYVFHHLLDFFGNNRQRTRPRVGFTTINTAHDYKGLRVQTLNQDLSAFARILSTYEDTLTILLADHGNTYTKYTSAMLEGRFEMYHPSFFMILSGGVKKWLGRAAVNSLRQNTKRLFTMIDVHKTVLGILSRSRTGKYTEQSGLLSLIPAGRSCEDLELALPNLCVCEGWDTPVQNDAKQVGVLEFAVGTLNNVIDSQRRAAVKNGLSMQRRCNRLFAKSFRNVRERSEGQYLITTLDFAVTSGPGSRQTEDVFHVEIQSTISDRHTSREMKILSYDRISQYGIYRKCKDPGVHVKLCVCSLKASGGSGSAQNQNLWQPNGELNIYGLFRLQPRYLGIPSEQVLTESLESKCIFFLARNFWDTSTTTPSASRAVISALNVCSTKDVVIHIDVTTSNFKLSRDFPMILTVEPQTITFVTVATRTVWYWDSSYRITTSVQPPLSD